MVEKFIEEWGNNLPLSILLEDASKQKGEEKEFFVGAFSELAPLFKIEAEKI